MITRSYGDYENTHNTVLECIMPMRRIHYTIIDLTKTILTETKDEVNKNMYRPNKQSIIVLLYITRFFLYKLSLYILETVKNG